MIDDYINYHLNNLISLLKSLKMKWYSCWNVYFYKYIEYGRKWKKKCGSDKNMLLKSK